MSGRALFIRWDKEEITFGSSPVPMEKIGRIIGLMNNAGVTTRKAKKQIK